MPAFNFIYDHAYKARAVAKGVAFELTKIEFRALCEQPCHYCGVMPFANTYRGRRGTVKTGLNRSTWVYNGLDRVDTKGGYTTGNVVPCCGICNHAKHTMPYADFLQWLDCVSKFATTRDNRKQ